MNSLKNVTSMSLLLVLASLIGGCGSSALRTVSSGQIGCAPSEVEITDDDVGWNTRSWTATCGGKRYYCSGGAGTSVSCKAAGEAR